jgi:hypothetical protein
MYVSGAALTSTDLNVVGLDTFHAFVSHALPSSGE